MKLEQLRQTISSSQSGDWHVITEYFHYRQRVDPLVDGGPVENHEHTAVYMDDISVTLSWGMPVPGHFNPLGPEHRKWWPNNFDSVYSILADVFYNGSLVDRYVGMHVVGRAVFPAPRTESIEPLPRVGAAKRSGRTAPSLVR